MKSLTTILENLEGRPDHVFLQEARDGQLHAYPGSHLANRLRRARNWLRAAGVKPGDRVALLAGNSVDWVTADLAILAEGAIAVPLYGRAQPAEMATMLADCTPTLVLVEGTEAQEALRGAGVTAPLHALTELADGSEDPVSPPQRAGTDPATIIYTSGTSGEPKGVVLNGDNLDFMLDRTGPRLDALMKGESGPDRVFHYLPFCFAGSWIMLLLCLQRRSILTLNTDLTTIVDDLGLVRPHYFQNVPVLLERMRDGVRQAFSKRALMAGIFAGAERAHAAAKAGDTPRAGDQFRLWLAQRALFPAVRRRLGPRLKALICGSAPLSEDTQSFFEMVGIQVLQVYGLTETTAILTMDEPGHAVAGCVGRAIDDVELKIDASGEILARGANIFTGYWNRDEATAECFDGEWFKTGDQGEMDEQGVWKIVGRMKNLLVPEAGHNVAPEPLEQGIAERVPAAEQVVVIGDARPHLAVIVTGNVDPNDLQAALEDLNSGLPHYKKVRGSMIVPQAFGPENGLLTANGKIRRGEVLKALAKEIDAMYERNTAAQQPVGSSS